MAKQPLTVKNLIARLQREVNNDQRVADFEVIWDNSTYTKFEVRYEGKWVRLPGERKL